MASINAIDGGRLSARVIMVWDPLVRLIHWSLVVLIALNATVVDDDSNLHEWIGYAAGGLIVVRLIWGLIGPRPARLSAFPPNPVAALRHVAAWFRGEKTVHLSHNPAGALMVYNLWFTVLLLAVSGYMMGTVRYFGVEWVEEVHEAAYVWLLISVALHVFGVFFASWWTGVPLVRAMIDGHKRIPEDREIE